MRPELEFMSFISSGKSSAISSLSNASLSCSLFSPSGPPSSCAFISHPNLLVLASISYFRSFPLSCVTHSGNFFCSIF